MLKNTRTTYGGVVKFLHWTMAILFFVMFGIAYTMTNISPSPVRSILYGMHKSTGLLLFGFFTLRFIWRLINVQPEVPASTPLWQKRAAAWNIFALYAVMLLMPVTGFLTSTLGGHDISFYWIFKISPLGHDKAASTFFSDAHEIISYVMIFLVSVHFLAALQHHYIRRDDVLRRMLPKSKEIENGL
jgi:cytochrome b561